MTATAPNGLAGTVRAWGDNSNGQLGDGSTTKQSTPVEVKGLQGVRTVQAGSGHVAAILEDATAVAWGRNAFGQVGDGTTENQALPASVQRLRGVVQVCPGGGHTLFLLDDGTVWTCGAGFFGCLGPENPGVVPVPIKLDGLPEIEQIASGGGHCLALAADGSVWTWGRDDYGQLGDGPDADRRPHRTIREYAGRSYPNRPVPAQVPDLTGVRAIAAGGGHSMALLPDGTLLAWGFNDRGQLGDGSMEHKPSPAPVAGLGPVQSVAGAYHHTLALLEDGTVQAFGLNDRGQVGDGSTEHRTRPVPVQGLSGVRAVAAKGGGSDIQPGDHGHSLALLDDGTVRSWGCNDHGELGDGTTTDRHTPVVVATDYPVRQITAGGEVPAFRENPGGGFSLALY
jgi:alpha-tubulin suppressor-like RCC1 family protein